MATVTERVAPKVGITDECLPGPPASPVASSIAASWILHDVQDPQSPDPVITSTHCSASSLTIDSGAGIEAPRLARFITWATP